MTLSKSAVEQSIFGTRYFGSGVEKVGELDDATLADILARILVFMGVEPL